jgi:CubicO group peptidase (beta-lactamase class C family)
MKSVNGKTSRRAFLGLAVTSPLAISAIATAGEAVAKYSDLQDLLTPIRKDSGLPAVACGVMKNGVLVAAGAVGVRKAGEAVSVTVSDKFHIGSCTKAMTATLVAMLVEQSKIKWGQTLADIFPERAQKIDSAYQKVSLEMLLTHRSGAPANGNEYGPASASQTAQRLAYLDAVLKDPPEFEPGTRHSYSNAGYIIAGAMLERVTGKAWEDLMKQRLFQPLGMTSAGFGPPAKATATDQPWGHVLKSGKFEPRYGDNPRALGPAGTVHCSMADYLKFADLHSSAGGRPAGLLGPASLAKLHAPPAKQDYAMGWGVLKREWARGPALTHAGSNTMNYFVVWLAPKINLCLAIAANAAGEKVPKALDSIAGALVRKFAE